MLNESYNIMRENDRLLEDLEAEENETDHVEPLMNSLTNNRRKFIGSGSVKSSMIMSSAKHLSKGH